MHDSFAVHVGHCLAGSRLMKATVGNSLTKHLQEHQRGKRTTNDAKLPPTYHQLPVSSDLQNLLHNTRSFCVLAVPSAFRIIPATFSGTVRGSHHIAQLGSALYRPRDTRRSKSWPPGSQKTSRSGNGKFCIAAALHEQGSRISRLLWRCRKDTPVILLHAIC